MARFYADEQFPRYVCEQLRLLGHDVLTVQEAGNANQRIPDDEVLAFATQDDRAVLTLNHSDFVRLHRGSSDHAGMVSCTNDLDRLRLVSRIDALVNLEDSLVGKFLRVVRPS